MKKIVCGIQQIGIGVPDVHEAWKWYKAYFGMDIRMFEEAAVAELMLPYTGGEPRERHAALALNLQGGGGFEIWQYTERTPKAPDFEIQLGDLGIFIGKIKSKNVANTYENYRTNGVNILGDLCQAPNGKPHFFIKDPLNNIFEIVEGNGWFTDQDKLTGASYGAILGVSDVEKSRKFYADILGYDTVIYDKTDAFDDLSALPGGTRKVRRMLLSHSQPRTGAFSPVLGPSQIELVQATDTPVEKIFKDRFWGDLGFIHLCFDIKGMDAFRTFCKEKGHPFTVDSGDSFDMGEAAGAFSYIEDPDGSLIEFVETHKIPILKKLGIYLNLRKRDPEKPLPRWMLKTLGWNKAKDI